MPLPPGPRARYPGQFLVRFVREPIAFLEELAREHGDVVTFRLGRERMVMVNHPDLIRDVLVTNNRQFRKGRGLERAKVLLGEGLLTSEGEFHLRQRRLAQPAFHRQRVAGYGDVMAAFAARTAGRWRDGERVDVAEQMMRLTLAIVGKTLFDADVEAEAGEIGGALTDVFNAFTFAVLPFGELLERLPLPMTRRFQRARARLDATIYRIIAERRAAGDDRGDLLSMLMLAHDDAGDGGTMSDLQLRDEAMTLFLAGHETTANALTWTWYLLSQHPEVEARLHAEVDAAFGAAELPSAAHMPALPYARMIVAESLRLYPPAWVIGRRAIEDYDVGDYTIPARSVVLMSQYLTHRDARFWPDPDRFDPERWTPEAQAARPKFAYYPFGGGPRVCIGEQFAWMEGVLALATIARLWRLRLAPGHEAALAPMITLRPRGGMPMVVERRGDRV
ncbi:MAG TPA: cytochrome P450 [Gemmatimonadaceae bacterium]|nr:cytochrome P450 [Gemmatimonadaceae bacterium]